ncbi:MAG: hypothetical protein WCZ17_01000 [Candidatus Kapaibacterium sp.]|jgi:hypothetical protein|nr:hypothetical protein [Candidatus Kapabacteria bacterium]
MKYILLTLLLIANECLANYLQPYSDYVKLERKKEADLIKNSGFKIRKAYRTDGVGDNINNLLISKEYFNGKGLLSKFETIDEYGVVQISAVFEYNIEDMLLSIEEKDNFRVLLQKQVFSYDPFSKLRKVSSNGFNDSKLQTMYFEYIEERDVAIETIKDSGDAVISYSVHLYDKSFQRIIKTTIYDKNDEIDGTKIFYYTENGLSGREIYAKDINEPYSIKYENVFNDKKQLIQVRNILFPDKLTVTVNHSYNDAGLLESTSMFDKDNKPITKIEYKYFIQDED